MDASPRRRCLKEPKVFCLICGEHTKALQEGNQQFCTVCLFCLLQSDPVDKQHQKIPKLCVKRKITVATATIVQ